MAVLAAVALPVAHAAVAEAAGSKEAVAVAVAHRPGSPEGTRAAAATEAALMAAGAMAAMMATAVALTAVAATVTAAAGWEAAVREERPLAQRRWEDQRSRP